MKGIDEATKAVNHHLWGRKAAKNKWARLMTAVKSKTQTVEITITTYCEVKARYFPCVETISTKTYQFVSYLQNWPLWCWENLSGSGESKKVLFRCDENIKAEGEVDKVTQTENMSSQKQIYIKQILHFIWQIYCMTGPTWWRAGRSSVCWFNS